MVGMDRLSDSASDPLGSPSQAAAVDAQVAMLPHYSDISAPSSPSVVPDTDGTPPSTRPPSLTIESEPDVILLGEETVQPPRRPPIQPADILAAVCCTPVDRAAAVAPRLAEQYDVGRLHDVLPTIIVIMQSARADLARTLLDENIRASMGGATAEDINTAGTFRLLNVVLSCSYPGFQFPDP